MSLRFASLVVLVVVCALASSSASAQEYRIGSGDILKVVVWGHEDLSKEYPVTNDGYVPFPLLGRVKADGLTVQQIGERLRFLLEKDYLVNPQVIVSVREYLSQKVQILGEAEKPGLYYLTGPT